MRRSTKFISTLSIIIVLAFIIAACQGQDKQEKSEKAARQTQAGMEATTESMETATEAAAQELPGEETQDAGPVYEESIITVYDFVTAFNQHTDYLEQYGISPLTEKDVNLGTKVLDEWVLAVMKLEQNRFIKEINLSFYFDTEGIDKDQAPKFAKETIRCFMEAVGGSEVHAEEFIKKSAEAEDSYTEQYGIYQYTLTYADEDPIICFTIKAEEPESSGTEEDMGSPESSGTEEANIEGTYTAKGIYYVDSIPVDVSAFGLSSTLELSEGGKGKMILNGKTYNISSWENESAMFCQIVIEDRIGLTAMEFNGVLSLELPNEEWEDQTMVVNYYNDKGTKDNLIPLRKEEYERRNKEPLVPLGNYSLD